ncbi:MAG: hypothetical protein MUC41_18285 [Syntrophobacteraceae bacterium]|jgi:hypothetical protein|nr:hypothetical protein [Syntrophobacteraceae bacterium]
MRNARRLLVAAALLVGAFSPSFPGMAQESTKASENWLLDAKDDTERFRRVQQMFGGFSAAMLVVAERYERTYDAVAEGNHELASYHWKKIREAMELGTLRRPGREANAQALFLKETWGATEKAIASKDNAKAKEWLLAARSACMACHMAEKVVFMNDQPLFRRTATFP